MTDVYLVRLLPRLAIQSNISAFLIITHCLFLDVGKEGEEFWEEGEEGGLPHLSEALVVVLGAADTALPEPLRERLELLELERLATDEIGDSGHL